MIVNQHITSRIRVFLCLLLASLFVGMAHADDPRSWQSRTPMPTARSGVTAVALENQVYVLGGQNANGQALTTVERYDAENDTWTTLPSMDIARFNASAAVLNDKIYVMGGQGNNSSVLQSVEVYDPVLQRWDTIGSLQANRAGLSALVLENTLYAAGGSNENAQFLNTVEYYDEAADQWVPFPAWDLGVARASFAALPLADSAFTFGGFSPFGPLNLVQRFNTTDGVMERAAFAPARGGLTAAALDGAAYVIGGRMSNNEVVATVNRYIPEENRWELAASLIEARENAAAVFADNQLFVFGGVNASGEVLASIEAFDVIAAPTATNDEATTPEDTAVTVDVLGNDIDPSGTPLTIAGFSQPQNGVVTQIDARTFRYVPQADYNGLDLFSYTVQNAAGASALATVQLTITPVNDPPQVQTLPVEGVLAETAYVYEIEATDAEGDAIVISAASLPAWLTLQDRGDGSAALTGTPALADVGIIPVTLSFFDGQDTSTQMFDLLVAASLPAIPILTTPTNNAEVDTPAITFTWIGDTTASYRFQLARTDTFSEILVDSTLVTPGIDLDSPGSGQFFWRVRAFNAVGTSDWSTTFSFGGVSPVSNEDEVPLRAFNLAPAFPNPFVSKTRIPFVLERTALTVSIAIYNLSGQEIKTLLAHPLPAGQHEVIWDGRDNQQRLVASGRYLVVMRVDDRLQTQLLTLVR